MLGESVLFWQSIILSTSYLFLFMTYKNKNPGVIKLGAPLKSQSLQKHQAEDIESLQTREKCFVLVNCILFSMNYALLLYNVRNTVLKCNGKNLLSCTILSLTELWRSWIWFSASHPTPPHPPTHTLLQITSNTRWLNLNLQTWEKFIFGIGPLWIFVISSIHSRFKPRFKFVSSLNSDLPFML